MRQKWGTLGFPLDTTDITRHVRKCSISFKVEAKGIQKFPSFTHWKECLIFNIPRLRFLSNFHKEIWWKSHISVVCWMILRLVLLCLTAGSNCEFLPCEASNPCENGAVCVEELDQDHFPLGFRCHCRQGFTGPRCEINVDECSSSPCFHGFCYDGRKEKKKSNLANMINNKRPRWKQTPVVSLSDVLFLTDRNFVFGHYCS